MASVARNDHFSAFAATYASFRPTYPDALFAWLAALAPTREHAWDCATGTGQAAVSLAAYFDQVTATDVGAGMIANATPHARIHYTVAPAEASALPDQSVDLITVAMALHWFDRDRFWEECQRVLRPGGVLAYWGYLLPSVSPAVDIVVALYHDITVGSYWPPDRGPLLNGYATVRPTTGFNRIAAPEFSMSADWSVDHLIGMLDSWSATHRARAATAQDPLAAIVPELRSAWGDTAIRPVSWPLAVHAFRL